MFTEDGAILKLVINWTSFSKYSDVRQYICEKQIKRKMKNSGHLWLEQSNNH